MISQKKNNKLVARAEKMVQVIADDLINGRTLKGYRHIQAKYRVGTAVVMQARILAGIEKSTKKQKAAEERIRKDPIAGKKISYLDECMYRPNGVNPLTVAWI